MESNSEKTYKSLCATSTGIGSLPYKTVDDAINLIFENFDNCPFWSQLSKVDRREDMTIQYIQGLPCIEYNKERERYFFNTKADDFYEKLEEFFTDYVEITSDGNLDKLEKYAITAPFTSTIPKWLEKIKSEKPQFAKGQIVGAISWGLTIIDDEGRAAIYDDVLRDVVVKGLTLKALWQIKKVKEVSAKTLPIIFLDEPILSQYGTSAMLTLDKSDVISILSEIVSLIQSQGALAGVHCCGKTDWTLLFESKVNVLNFDAFGFAKSLTLYPKELMQFMKGGGLIAWGIVPTLNADSLKSSTLDSLKTIFYDAIDELVKKGVDKHLLLTHSMFTPSCGCGGLSIELAEKAISLTSDFALTFRNENDVTILKKESLN